VTGRGCSAEAATAAMTATMTGATAETIGAMTAATAETIGAMTAATGVMTGETVVAVGLGCSGNGELDNQAGRAYRNWFGIRSISRG